MICHSRFRVFFITLLTVLISASMAYAQNLSLQAPSLANDAGALLARFGVLVEEEPVLKGDLENGAELVLRCDVKLYKTNEYWLDRKISSATFESTLKYDALKKEFIMLLQGRDTPLRNSDIVQLLKDGWGTIEVSLGQWAMLERGEKYSLVLNTTMNETGAPEGFTRFLYFWSWEAGADNSFQLDFTY